MDKENLIDLNLKILFDNNNVYHRGNKTGK